MTGTRTAEIAAAAARLIVEEGLEYGAAKRRAARDLRVGRGSVELPGNDVVEDEVRSYIDCFHADSQPAELAALRAVAASWMERLAEFRPHLAGAVWRGTATRRSSIHIELYCDDSKSAELALIDRRVDYEVSGSEGPRGRSIDVLNVFVRERRAGRRRPRRAHRARLRRPARRPAQRCARPKPARRSRRLARPAGGGVKRRALVIGAVAAAGAIAGISAALWRSAASAAVDADRHADRPVVTLVRRRRRLAGCPWPGSAARRFCSISGQPGARPVPPRCRCSTPSPAPLRGAAGTSWHWRWTRPTRCAASSPSALCHCRWPWPVPTAWTCRDSLGNNVGALPFTVVFDADGKPLQRHLGALDSHWLEAGPAPAPRWCPGRRRSDCIISWRQRPAILNKSLKVASAPGVADGASGRPGRLVLPGHDLAKAARGLRPFSPRWLPWICANSKP